MILADMSNYQETRDSLRFETPAHYNFGFDVIDTFAGDPDKVAYIAVDADAQTITPHTFKDLSLASNRVANWLTGLGCAKDDLAFVMIPRLPAWYEIMIGCGKAGVVAMPGTNLLTSERHRVPGTEVGRQARDRYRGQRGQGGRGSRDLPHPGALHRHR